MATATRATRKMLVYCTTLVVVLGTAVAQLCLRDNESGESLAPIVQPPANHQRSFATGKEVAAELGRQTSAGAIPERYIAAARLFEIGCAGGVRIDEDFRLALEGALSSLSDSPTQDELVKFGAALNQIYPYEDSQKMLDLVRRYADYLAAIREQVEPRGIPSNLVEAEAVFDSIQALQSRYFDSETRQAIFGPFDRYARLTMQAAFIQADESLAPEQKAARLGELRSQLPEGMRSQIPISGAATSAEKG